MACQTIECKSNCACCTRALKLDSTAVAIADGALQITIPATTFSECQPVCLFINQPFPTGFFNAKITIQNGSTGSAPVIPVVTKRGRNIRIDTDSAFNIVQVRFFSDPNRFMFCRFAIRNGTV